MTSNVTFAELKKLLDAGQSSRAKELLLALQAGYLTLVEEIQHLHLRINSFEDLLACSKNVHTSDGLVWLELSEGRKEGPFCPLCYDTDKSLIRLEKDTDCLYCPSCEAEYPRFATPAARGRVLSFDKSCQRLGL